MFRWTVHLKGGHKNCFHAAVVVGHKLYSFGDMNDSDQIEVHILNTVSLRWKKFPPRPIEVPSSHHGHTAVLVEEMVYIWGGGGELYCNVLYAFDVDTHSWFKPNISGTIPEARIFHSACVLEKVMYIYGGNTLLTGYTNDIYKLDTTTMIWSLINTRGTPPVSEGSEGHSGTATIIGTKMFVFEGYLGGQNIRVFDTETNSWLSTPSAQPLPEERWDYSAFAYNGELYMFGGINRHQYFNDLWKFSQETFSWKQVEPKGKNLCRIYGMCCLTVGDCIIIFGGCKLGHILADGLYMLDLSPSLKTLCKLSVIHNGLEQSELPHDIKWELKTMTTNSNRKKN